MNIYSFSNINQRIYYVNADAVDILIGDSPDNNNELCFILIEDYYSYSMMDLKILQYLNPII